MLESQRTGLLTLNATFTQNWSIRISWEIFELWVASVLHSFLQVFIIREGVRVAEWSRWVSDQAQHLVGQKVKILLEGKMYHLGLLHACCFRFELWHFRLKLLPKCLVTLLLNSCHKINGLSSYLKCEVWLKLVVDLVRLGLDVLHCLLHLLPRLHVRPVAVRLWTDVLP